ncbi:MAG TPA: hypothetical protein VJX92_15420 [Methylomirabilota bacterium]|nr:hypothetical protein [Methylomirabilota bacterium]
MDSKIRPVDVGGRRLAAAAALLSLLAVATAAHAGDAWMLWATIRGGPYNNIAAPVSASDTKEACERALGDHVARQVATAKRSGVKVKASETLVTVQSRNPKGAQVPTTTQYVCLPDTMDPRKTQGN